MKFDYCEAVASLGSLLLGESLCLCLFQIREGLFLDWFIVRILEYATIEGYCDVFH